MTNLVVATVALLVQTNSSKEIAHPAWFGSTTYITNVTCEVVTYTHMGVSRTITNAVETNVTVVTVRKIPPEIPPVRNQPLKP